jgi:hypothetical protein
MPLPICSGFAATVIITYTAATASAAAGRPT